MIFYSRLSHTPVYFTDTGSADNDLFLHIPSVTIQSLICSRISIYAPMKIPFQSCLSVSSDPSPIIHKCPSTYILRESMTRFLHNFSARIKNLHLSGADVNKNDYASFGSRTLIHKSSALIIATWTPSIWCCNENKVLCILWHSGWLKLAINVNLRIFQSTVLKSASFEWLWT